MDMNLENVYDDNNAMGYEYLIRRAHQCGRYGVSGANADEYRRLIRKANMYISEKALVENNQPRQWGEPLEKMLADYMVSLGQIIAYIKTATSKVQNDHYNDLTTVQREELEEVEMLMHEANIESITEAIDRANAVFKELGLKASAS
ncbi:MAG: hypothetical protein ACPG4Y_05545 [Chitinophagales bacterium]